VVPKKNNTDGVRLLVLNEKQYNMPNLCARRRQIVKSVFSSYDKTAATGRLVNEYWSKLNVKGKSFGTTWSFVLSLA
jgi:hypothetical protein